MIYYLTGFILIAIGMQVYSNRKSVQVYEQTRGVIKSRPDLLAVKAAINLSMKLAVIYILLFVLFVFVLIISVARGGSLGEAAFSLFVFGIITLPVGLIGKTYEKKVKTLQVQADDPQIAEKFQLYLKQWNEPRWKLPDD
jgi:sulfite exporter TauE/SafE